MVRQVDLICDNIPAGAEPKKIVPLRSHKTHCVDCPRFNGCLPSGLDEESVRRFDEMIGRQRRLGKSEVLFHAGTDFHAIYAIRVGTLKTSIFSEDGREQVAGYHLAGDVIGCDAITTNSHTCKAVALEDIEVCAVPFHRLGDLDRGASTLQQRIRLVLAREITRNQAHMLLLGGMTAEQRVTSFLLDVSARYGQLGYSATEFVLRMGRLDIGSYLGLKLETVSRVFSRLQADGLIQRQGRDINLLDTPMLNAMLGKVPPAQRA